MKKNTYKIIPIILAIMIIFSTICLPSTQVMAETTGTTSDGFMYTANGTYATITGYYGPNGLVTIPSTIDNLPVTRIGTGAFRNRLLTSVIIPESVTTIGDYAFWECIQLTSVIIPDSVTTIGNSAFEGCSKLTSITMENGGITIVPGTFPKEPTDINPTIQDAVGLINNSTPPILDNYKNAFIEGVTAGNLNEVNAAVSSAKAAKGSNLTKKEIQEVVGIVDINKGNMTFTNYRYGGIAGVTPDNLNAVNTIVSSAKTAGSSLTKENIQDSVNNVISAITAINSGSASVSGYVTAGITDVTVDNIDFIKSLISSSKSGGTSLTRRQIQCIVDKLIAAILTINSGSASFGDYKDAGITGVTVDNINAVNAVVARAKNVKGSALTAAEIQAAITDGAATVEITDKDGTLTAQLKKLNGTEFTTSSAVTYEWYRDNVVIDGENNNKYIVSVNDIEKDFKLKAKEYNLISNTITIPSNYKFQVDSVNTIYNINVDNGTSKNDIGLPNTVNVTLKNLTTISANVSWYNENSTYDGNTAGTYKFTGILSLPSGVTNPNNLKASVDVIVGKSTITSAYNLPDINVANGTDMSSIGLPTSVEVPLINAITTSAAVSWDNGSPDYDGNIAGTYKFTGTLSMPSGVANPNDYKALVNVIVKAALPVIPPENPIPSTQHDPIIPEVTEATTPAAVTIKGTTRVGKILEAVLLTNDNARFTTGAGVTYRWYRLSDKASENGDEIGDNNTYKLTSNDKSKYIKVVAKYDGKTFEYIVGQIRKRQESNSSSSSSSDDDSNSNSNSSNGNTIAQVNIPENIPNGWQKQSDNTWKYGENGKYVIGWKMLNGLWYFLDSNGTMETGFKQEGDKTYYLENSGAMVTDWELINGSWYLFDEHGVMIIGWAQVDSKWYYLNPTGTMATGWINLDGKWYYLYGDGSLAVDTTINGYNVDENGVWVN